MSSNRTSVGLTLIAGAALTVLGTTGNNYDTSRAQDLSSKLEKIVPGHNIDRTDWVRSALDRMGLTDSFTGFEVDLRFVTNARGNGIEVYNSGKYIGTVDLDRAQNYLDSVSKK